MSGDLWRIRLGWEETQIPYFVCKEYAHIVRIYELLSLQLGLGLGLELGLGVRI